MTVTEAALRARFPTVFPAAFSSAVLVAAIAEAEVRIDRDTLGDLGDAAATYLAAHIARLDFLNSIFGISSATAGAVSVSYMTPPIKIDAIATGFYAEFLRILRLVTPQITLSGMVG